MVDVQNLKIGYRGKSGPIFLSEIHDFNLQPGSLTALVGPNGIGKSTLLQTLSGSIDPLAGTLTMRGLVLSQMTPHQRSRQLSLVLTKSQHSQQLMVEEFVSLGRLPYANWVGALQQEDKSMILKALEATDLISLRYKKCGDISDGEMQRVAIARALAQDTPIILLDEPTTHLDLHHKALVLKLLKDLATIHQKVVLYATHDIELALDIVDKILLMTTKSGQLMTPNQLIEEKHLDHLFPKEHVYFDPKTKRFSMKD